MNLSALSTSWNWTHTWFVLLELAYFAQHNVLKIHLYGSMCQYFLLFQGWVIFHCVSGRPYPWKLKPTVRDLGILGCWSPWSVLQLGNPPKTLLGQLIYTTFCSSLCLFMDSCVSSSFGFKGLSWLYHPGASGGPLCQGVLILQKCENLPPHPPFTPDSQLLKYRFHDSKQFTLVSPWPRTVPGSQNTPYL